tara:strand:+ start:3520 stop:3915 length:396 start_codon:yes stop_codon:yes gene_type:complete
MMDDALKLTIGGGVALNAVMLYSFGYAWLRRGAPFVPTAQRKLDAIFGPSGLLQPLRSRSHLVDLGSGGGATVRAAVREGGFGRATGYDPTLVGYSQLRSALCPNERHRLKSLWEAELHDADVVHPTTARG